MNAHRTTTRRFLPGSPFNVPTAPPPPIEKYDLNDRVTHDKYGLGTVIGVEENIAVLVDFGPQQERIVSPYSKMTKL